MGNTRGSRAIDRIFVNVNRAVNESGTLDPLETVTEAGITKRSDHRIAYCRLKLARREAFCWETFSYRSYNERSVKKFKEWITWQDWDAVLAADCLDSKAEAYQRTIVEAVERFIPLKKVKRKTSDLPWMDKKTKKMIEDRKKLFIEEGGRTEVWKQEKKRTNEAVRARKHSYFDRQKYQLLAEDANRNFYKHVRNLGKAERP